MPVADSDILPGREVVHAKWPDRKGIVTKIVGTTAHVKLHSWLDATLNPSGEAQTVEAPVSSWRHVWARKCNCHRVFEQDCPIRDMCVHRVRYDDPGGACAICENST